MAVQIFFDEILLSSDLFSLGDATGSPEFANTNIRAPGTGAMAVELVRYDPQHLWQMDFKMLTQGEGATVDQLDYFLKFWYGGFGSLYGFRVRIEWDHLANLEVIATGDGLTCDFFLTRTYNRPGTTSHPYIRRIIKPVVITNLSTDSVTLTEADGITTRIVEQAFQVFLDGVEVTTGWKISNVSGKLSFTKKVFTADSSTNVFTSTAHGLADGNEIKLENSGGALPAPLAAGTSYFVRDKTTNTFKLAATLGGSAIDITTNGTGTNKISGPAVGKVITWSGTFDTPMRIWSNSFQAKNDFPAEIKAIPLREMLAHELGV